ncbi:Haem-NO-binding [[Luteovulum] sphaeroides subsp. megalophilum]|uniref:heme NO-binding domain-containing protein n=1 Tax=Cereibacter sphaeroides TaxID=1063 RepID=UPI000B71FE32|nr:heme NO-binding domain-containing protein [Cereibacter sphaeroides]MWP39928.1 heme NO-binding protein [Cereibacter sphaeroides]SNT11426.1 Haem-NO-binding [[Luteovulum] sphaeroides subsp. megalophilum]
MHGLVNRAIECFLRDTYSPALWADVARDARLGFDTFEPMLTYELSETEAVIAAAAHRLSRSRDALLEDVGTYLVSHPTTARLRRLLRFGGVTFTDFLHSLDDLPDRARLALPDLDLPDLQITELGPNRFRLICASPLDGMGHVMLGLLRAMADDYGVLVMLVHRGQTPEGEAVSIALLDPAFSAGRPFDLAERLG